jgi:hypothetical protein
VSGSISGSVVVHGITIGAAPVTAPGYDLLGTGITGRTRRRDTVTSPWVHFETEVASVKGALFYTIELQAVGTTFGGASTLVDTLVTAVEAKTFTLVETLDGHVETYTCRAASQIDCPIDRTMLLNARRPMTITIPVKRA